MLGILFFPKKPRGKGGCCSLEWREKNGRIVIGRLYGEKGKQA